MATVKLLDGTEIPWLAWGNGSGKGPTEAFENGKLVLAAGIRHIDTAQIYGTEKEAGDCVKAVSNEIPRDQVWITTKLSQVNDGPVAIVDIPKSIQESLDKIGTVPNLFLIHNPFVAPPNQILEAWQVMERLKDEGKLKSIGVSNFRPQDLELVLKNCKHKPVVNQLEYHPYVLSHLEPVLKIMREHGIVVEAFGPLTPLLRTKSSSGGPLKPILTRIAQRLSSESGQPADEAAVVLLWIKATGAVAITASGNPERIKKLGAVFKLPDLKPEEVEEISEVGKKVHFRHYREHMEVDFPTPDLPEP